MLVNTEINRLQEVIIHTPDSGIGRISPKRAEELLFDDIVYLPQMIEEHDIFRNVLEAFVGKEGVFEAQVLLKEGLDANPELKKELIEKVIDFEELANSTGDLLLGLDSETLSHVLITGYHKASDYILFDPIPNFIFTRDIAVTVKDHIIITKAFKEARQRENLLTRFIFLAHPKFSDKKKQIINLNNLDLFPPSRKGEKVSIEGGDMMMIQNDYLLIGCSERTSRHAFHSVKNELFKREAIGHLVQVNIPVDRSYMHIDTLFTRINHNDIVCFKPIVYDGLGSNVIVHTPTGIKATYASVKDFFIEEINPNMNFIFSGNGESPYQEREQWTDGCNLVALKPGVGITYDRNIITEVAFKEAGYNVIGAKDFLNMYQGYPQIVDDIQNTIITLPSGELSRARGGSHCMTCPIKRSIN